MSAEFVASSVSQCRNLFFTIIMTDAKTVCDHCVQTVMNYLRIFKSVIYNDDSIMNIVIIQ